MSEFWRRKRPPLTPDALTAAEQKYGFSLPKDLRELYLASNGGRTDYVYFARNGETVSLLQGGELLPFDELETIENFIQAYDLDEENLAEVSASLPKARIISRVGFEYFVFIVPSAETSGSWVGRLDLAVPFGAKPKVELICKADELVGYLCPRK